MMFHVGDHLFIVDNNVNSSTNFPSLSNESFNGRPTFSSHHTTSGHPLDAYPTLQCFFVICLAIQSVFGTIGNLLVMAAVLRMPNLRTAGNAFIVNLSLADIFVTAITQPSNIIGALWGAEWFRGRPILCSVIGTLCATGCVASTWNICMISVNRYILICHPELYTEVYTKKRTILLCHAVWFLIYAIELPNHVGWGDKRFSVVFYVCTFANHVHSYALFYMGLGVFVPIAASFLAYLGIYLKVRNSALVRKRISSRYADHKMSKAQRARLQAKHRVFREDVKMAHVLFRVFVIFLLMWLPVAILIVMGKGTEVSPVWYILTILLAHGNSSINCVVYAASLESFRDGYMKVLGIRSKRCEEMPWSKECAMAMPSYISLKMGDSPTCEVTSAGLLTLGLIGRTTRLDTLTSNNDYVELDTNSRPQREVSVCEPICQPDHLKTCSPNVHGENGTVSPNKL